MLNATKPFQRGSQKSVHKNTDDGLSMCVFQEILIDF